MTESNVLAAIDELERDEIDDLVDAQMRQTMSGWDHNINQARCIYCGEDTHSLPIKQRMRELRSLWQSTIHYFEAGPRVSQAAADRLDAYRYDEDDSEIVCPGTEFIGPWASRTQIGRNQRAAERERTIDDYLSGDPSYQRLRTAVESGIYLGSQEALGCFYAGLPLPDVDEDESLWEVRASFGPFARPYVSWAGLRTAAETFTTGVRTTFEQMRAALTSVLQFPNPWILPEVWFEPRWWRFVDSDPDVEAVIEVHRETDDGWLDMSPRSFITSERQTLSIRHRPTGRHESHDLLTDPETGAQLIQRLAGDEVTFEVFLREPPTIGEWVPAQAEEAAPEEPTEPRNRRQRRGQRERPEPMWANPYQRRRRTR